MSTRTTIRSTWDFTRYLAGLRTGRIVVLLIDTSFVVIAAITVYAAAGTTADIPALVMFTVSLGRLGWSLWKLARAVQDLLRGASSTILTLGGVDLPERRLRVMDLSPSELEQRHGFQPVETRNGEMVFRSDEVDQRFQDGAATVRLERSLTKERRLRRHILANRDRLVPMLVCKFRTSVPGQAFFNQGKLGLASDVLADGEVSKYALCTYFDSVLTNEASSLVLADADGDRRIDCTDMFPFELDARGEARLSSLGLSGCANHIGVSTIGITRDQYLVIWEQSSRAQQSQGLLAPTGSGSADATDLAEDLVQTLAYAMRRELHEESVHNRHEIPIDKVGTTTVLGYFRWLRRAGKPEFVGVTELEIDAGDLEPNPAEVRTPGTSVAHCYYVPTVSDLETCLAQLLEMPNLSVPLELNLLALGAALRRPCSLSRISEAIGRAA